jgi:large conductance mechanosensitive channel
MAGIFSEFETFIKRGNVLDLAVGVIVGTAFGNITKSLTDDVIMPAIGALVGGLDFSRHFIRLGAIPASYKGPADSYAALKAAGVPLFGYGAFVTAVINFLLVAWIVFLLIRSINRILALAQWEKEGGAPPPPPESADVALLREIRDELRARPKP